MNKIYKLSDEELQPMVPRLGGALATDKITVDGNKVDYMARGESDREEDSGWVFYGGGETQEYLEEPSNTSVFSLNTICNYDPEIISFLTYPPGTEIERNNEGKLELLTKEGERPALVFLPPVDAGRIFPVKNWSFEIVSHMLRRFDDSSLVIWKPGFTIWLNAYTPSNPDIQERLTKIRNLISKEAYGLELRESGGVTALKYQLEENSDQGIQKSANIFGFTEDQELHMSVYFDSADSDSEIQLIWQSLSADSLD